MPNLDTWQNKLDELIKEKLVKNNFKLDSSRNDSENKNNVIFTLTAK